MSFYKINFEQLRQDPQISEILSALERGLERFGIDFYLVGALARDVWMRGIYKITSGRTTKDIDFAVLINDKGDYEALKDHLIAKEKFAAVKDNAFVLLWKGNFQVDLLPFGAIEDEDGRVEIQGIGYTSTLVPGFKEVYDSGLPMLELQNQHQFKFCTLPGIVLLKLIAWDDRPEIRRDDIKDISDILKHFFSMYDNEIWENHNDLFETENDNLMHIAARVMGREIGEIAGRNAKVLTRIEGIFHANTVDIRTSKIAVIMVEYFKNTVEDNVVLLKEIKRGVLERRVFNKD